MEIIEPGNIKCECGNDELVFVRSLPPFDFIFVILLGMEATARTIDLAETIGQTRHPGSRKFSNAHSNKARRKQKHVQGRLKRKKRQAKKTKQH